MVDILDIKDAIQKRLKWMTEMRDDHKKRFDQSRNNLNEFALYQRYVEGVEQLEWVLRVMEYGN